MVYKNDGWSCKKKSLYCSTFDCDDILRPPMGTKIQHHRKYDIQPGGLPKNICFQNMLLSMHIEPTYSKIKFWGPANTPISNFRKSQKMVQYLEKTRIFSNFLNTSFCSQNTAHKTINFSYDPFSQKSSLLVTILALFDPIKNIDMKNAGQGRRPRHHFYNFIYD